MNERGRLAPMSLRNSRDESQRDSSFQPRVASNELPWVTVGKVLNPNGVASRGLPEDATPLGLMRCIALSQGSSFLATLGYMIQSLRDCGDRHSEFPFGRR